MGKAKKRSLKNGIHEQFPNLTREDALNFVVQNIENKHEVLNMITLFGFTAEEMLEAGAAYEDVMSFGGLVNL